MKTREINTAFVIFFLIMSIWDFGVTYYFYQDNPIQFLELEANYPFVLGLKNSIPFFLSPVIFFNFGLIGYFYLKRRDIDLLPISKNLGNGFWSVIIIGGTLGHYLGGASWLVFM